jgi:hypothetical protein
MKWDFCWLDPRLKLVMIIFGARRQVKHWDTFPDVVEYKKHWLLNNVTYKLIEHAPVCTGALKYDISYPFFDFCLITLNKVLSARRKVLLVKLTVTQLVKKLPSVSETRWYITVFARDRHWFLSWTSFIQSSLQISRPKFCMHFYFSCAVLLPSHSLCFFFTLIIFCDCQQSQCTVTTLRLVV